MTTATETHKLGGRPGRLLMMAAVGLVAVAVVWSAVLLVRGNFGSSGGANPPPPPPPASTTPVPSPSPTLSEREQESHDAKEAYKALYKALDEFYAEGGGPELPDEILAMMTKDGTARKTLSEIAAVEYEDGYASTGYTEVVNLKVRSLDLDSDTSDTPEAVLSACLDLTGLEVTKDGEPVDAPYPSLSADELMQKVDGKWLLHESTTKGQKTEC